MKRKETDCSVKSKKLIAYVDEKYKSYLKDKDKLEALEGVDVEAALERYASKGEWDKAISIADKKSPKLLPKYVAQYATNLIKEKKVINAMNLYVNHGAPAIPQNFNIYKRIFQDIVSLQGSNKPQAYKMWSDLRDMFYDLCKNMTQSSLANGSEHAEFEYMLNIAHYYATRSAAMTQNSLTNIATKLSVSLLRHTDLIPADKAFYEAGMMCKSVGWENMAFVFLNRYLDMVEAIEEKSLEALDHTDFVDTDIPSEIPLPDTLYVSGPEHEEVKEWVLAVSMDQKVTHELPQDERGTYEASLYSPNSSSKALPCIVTGYPVLQNKIDFKLKNKVANKDDWNKLLMAIKTSHNEDLQDVFKFIGEWCGIPQTAGYSFQ